MKRPYMLCNVREECCLHIPNLFAIWLFGEHTIEGVNLQIVLLLVSLFLLFWNFSRMLLTDLEFSFQLYF